MAKQERCPICDVPVKAENLIRHLDANHPRHPDTPALTAKLKVEPGRASAKRSTPPIRLRGIHVAVIAIVILLGSGAYFVAPYLSSSAAFPVTGCINDATVVYHIHAQLGILIQGTRYAIPNNLGNTAACTHPLHTHQDYSPASQPAIIHVESPVIQAYTLGQLFQVWGQPFSQTNVVGYQTDAVNRVTMTVNGANSTAFGSLVFQDGQVIVISYGP